jgi:glutamate-ammonia-ligase adenylyltransferase
VVILALGKYGSCERTVDADLDVMFLTVGGRGDALHLAGNFAAGVVGRLSAVTDDGPGFAVDARLRPEGRSAPLVTDIAAWRVYLRARASLWERQALTRARVVAGDDRTSELAMREILEFVYATPLPAGWTDDIVSMRRRTEKRSRTRDTEFLDFKFGPGGIMDVEFLAQMLLLHAGRAGAPLQARPLRDILTGVPGAVLATGERDLLLEAYAFFRRVELMMRTAIEDRSSMLPEGEKLDRLAGALAIPQASDLRRGSAGRMEAVRETFLSTAERLRRTT